MRLSYPEDISIQAATDYLNRVPMGEITKRYGMDKTTVYRMVRKHGGTIRSQGDTKRIYSIDHTFFDKIDTHEKAQILGFIYADGCINDKGPDSNPLQIVLSPVDIEYLRWISAQMKSDRPLFTAEYDYSDGKTRKVASFTASHPNIAASLAKLGVTPRKSLTVGFPTFDQVPAEFVGSFICGVFEGDGCIHLGKIRNGPTFEATVSIIGSAPFIQEMQKRLALDHDIDCVVTYRPTKQDIDIALATIIRVSSIMRFMDLIYANRSHRMERKHQKFVEWRAKYQETVGMDGQMVYELIDRKPFTPENMERTVKLCHSNGMAAATAFHLKSPTGSIHHADAVKPFCREFNLTSSNVFKVLDGRARQHKGWLLPTSDELAAAVEAGLIVASVYKT